MATLEHRTGPHALAAAARSILACPASVDVVVDGFDSLAELVDPADGDLAMHDADGVPTFSCAPGAGLARAALGRAGVVLEIASGLGRPGSPERSRRLKLAGRLAVRRDPGCDCCGEPHDLVEVEVDVAVLLAGDSSAQRVPLEHFRSPAHQLNQGFLQRSAEHATSCHQDELRHVVATLTGTRMGDLLGVQLTEVSSRGAVLRWVDVTGSQEARIAFPHPARSPRELGHLLRRQLHAGLC